MRVRCPNCGMVHSIENKSHTFESRAKLPNVAAAIDHPAAPGYSARRETPAYLPSTEAHISIPFRQSMIFGLFKAPVGGVAAYSLAYIADTASKSLELTTWGYLAVTGAGMLIVGFWVASQKWESRLGFYDSLLWKVEEASQMDIDGDGEIGEPAAPHRVEVELRRNGKPWKFESLEIEPDKLIKLARAMANGQSFAERTAADCGISRKKFNGLRDKFVSRGLANWKGEPGSTEGVELTDDGLDTIAEIATTPLPRSQRQGENTGGILHAPKPTQDNDSNYERFDHIKGVR